MSYDFEDGIPATMNQQGGYKRRADWLRKRAEERKRPVLLGYCCNKCGSTIVSLDSGRYTCGSCGQFRRTE